MDIKGMDTHFISVSSIDRSLALYRDWMGMELIDDEMLPPDEIQQLWQLPPGTQAHAAWLKSQMQTTMLGLIEFQPNSGKVIRQPMTHDYGHWAVAFWVKDTYAVYEGLTPKGYKFVSPPFSYNPDWTPYSVKELVLIGPDKITVGHFEKVSGEEIDSQNNYVRFDHCAQYIRDMDESIQFYCDVLGLDLRDRLTLSPGLLDQLLVVPPGTKTETAMIHKKDQVSCTIQLLKVAMEGKPLAAIARPPNLGVFMMSFEVDDLSQYIKRIGEVGVSILTGLVELHDKVHDRINAITTAGPNGELIQLFEC